MRSQADALLACDFFETVPLSGTRLYVFAAIEHANRRAHILGATAHPTAACVVQATKNLVTDLEDAGCRARYQIRDRDRKIQDGDGFSLRRDGHSRPQGVQPVTARAYACTAAIT